MGGGHGGRGPLPYRSVLAGRDKLNCTGKVVGPDGSVVSEFSGHEDTVAFYAERLAGWLNRAYSRGYAKGRTV